MSQADEARELAVEKLAAELHEVYWQQSITQRDMKGLVPRHPRDYNELSEDIKDYDRALARYVLQREANARLDEAKKWAHNWYGGYDDLGLSGGALEAHREMCRDCQRIAELERAIRSLAERASKGAGGGT